MWFVKSLIYFKESQYGPIALSLFVCFLMLSLYLALYDYYLIFNIYKVWMNTDLYPAKELWSMETKETFISRKL